MGIDYDKFKKEFDESFGKVDPNEFVKKMENLGYKFKSISSSDKITDLTDETIREIATSMADKWEPFGYSRTNAYDYAKMALEYLRENHIFQFQSSAKKAENGLDVSGIIKKLLREHPEYRCLDIINKTDQWLKDNFPNILQEDHKKEEIAEKIKEIVLEEHKKGNIVVATFDGLQYMKLADFVEQPAEGLLYDLNRTESVILTFIKDPKWVNDYAVATVIRELKNKIDILSGNNNRSDLESD